MIGTNAVGGGGGIWRWDGKTWVTMNGDGVRIDVDPQGNAWVRREGGLVEISVDGRGVPYGANASKQIWMGSK